MTDTPLQERFKYGFTKEVSVVEWVHFVIKNKCILRPIRLLVNLQAVLVEHILSIHILSIHILSMHNSVELGPTRKTR